MCLFFRTITFGLLLALVLPGFLALAQVPACDPHLVFCLRHSAPKLARLRAEQGWAWARQQADPAQKYRALQVLIAASEAGQDVEAVQRYSQQAHGLARQIGEAAQQAVLAEVSTAKKTFEPPAKVSHLAQFYAALMSAEDSGNPQKLALARLELGRQLNQAGLADQARLHLQAVQGGLPSLADRNLEAEFWLALTETDLRLGRAQMAREEAQRALPLAQNDSLMAMGYFLTGKAALSMNQTGLADLYLRKALELALKSQNYGQFQSLYHQTKEMAKPNTAGTLGPILRDYKDPATQLALNVTKSEKESVEQARMQTVVEKNRMSVMYGSLKKSYEEYETKVIYAALALLFAGLVAGAIAYHKTKNFNRLLRKQRGEIIEKNATLEQQNQLLQVLNTDKSDLMSMLAHDMRSPLNAVMGLSQLLELEGNLNGDQQLYIQKIHETVNRANQMIRELLDADHLEQQATVAFTPTDLPLLVQDLLAEQRGAAQAKHIRLFWSSDLKQWQLHTAPDLLKRVVENLLTNAIKFSPNEKNIYISLTETPKEVSISVRDEGPGLTAEDHKRLFRKFQKLSARPTGGEASTGLGLAIVKTLTEKLHGQVQVQSKPGEGAEFVVTLPKQTADLATGAR
jgi:signal transduction histidine kinase